MKTKMETKREAKSEAKSERMLDLEAGMKQKLESMLNREEAGIKRVIDSDAHVSLSNTESTADASTSSDDDDAEEEHFRVNAVNIGHPEYCRDEKKSEKQLETTDGFIDLLVGITDNDDIITSETIGKLFKNHNIEWCRRLFCLFDRNNNGFITLHDFLDELERLEFADWRVQATFEFQLHDTHGNSILTEKEFTEAMIFSAKSSKLNLAPATLTKLVSSVTRLIAQTSKEPDFFSLEEYLLALEKNPILRKAFSFCPTKFLHRCRYGNGDANMQQSGSIFKIAESNIHIAKTERISIGIKVLYAAIVIIFSYLIAIYQQSMNASTAVIIARIGGGQLNFHTSLLLFTMLRKTQMVIGNNSYFLSRVLCLDLMTTFHAQLGKWTVLWTIVHIVGHLMNYIHLKYSSNATPYDRGQLFYRAYVTGIVLSIVLTAISLSYMIRKRNYKFKGFEIFYCTHRLTYFYAILLLFHGSKCWQWVAWPLVMLLSEWLYRFYNTVAVKPVCARLLAANVTELVLPRPANFGNYTAGSYAFICVPEISSIEWHPFTIASSSYRRDGTLSFYIRKSSDGSWTDKLRKLVEKKKEAENYALRVSRIKDERRNSFGAVNVDNISIGCSPATASATKQSFSRPSAYTQNVDNSRVMPPDIGAYDVENARVNVLTTPIRRKSATDEAILNGKYQASTAIANIQECTIKYSESGTVRTFNGLQVYVDGPYFGPTSHVFSVNHAIFAAGGIGITPFVSILESLMQMDRPAMVDNGLDAIHGLNKLKRLDFYWLNNDLDCTSWLTPMLQAAENIRVNNPDSALHRILHIHIFLTSITEKTMGRDEALLHLSIDAMRPSDTTSSYYDPLFNLKHKIHVGSPNWGKILQHLGEKSPNPQDMSCFFCGPKPIGRSISAAANDINVKNKDWNVRYTEEFFD